MTSFTSCSAENGIDVFFGDQFNVSKLEKFFVKNLAIKRRGRIDIMVVINIEGCVYYNKRV
jgi:hypothetical protein